MIKFGTGRDLDLALAGKGLGKRFTPEFNAQNDRAGGVYKRLYQDDVPGVLLADEVGKGKTYVALAVAFARLAENPQARILILTHSRHMASVWARRWREVLACARDRNLDWPARRYDALEELAADARDGRLPKIGVASYEMLKAYGSAHQDIGRLRYALGRSSGLIGLGMTSSDKRGLIEAVIDDAADCDLRRIPSEPLPEAEVNRILAWIDREAMAWKMGAKAAIEDVLDRVSAHAQLPEKRCFDLLIIDEAHKLDGVARHRVVTRLLHKRFDKCLLVTATPFALSVDQFRRRLLDFVHARSAPKDFRQTIEALPLSEFSQAVGKRVPYPRKAQLESALRQYMVRASWNHEKERDIIRWSDTASPQAILPTLLLERVIDRVMQTGKRTHIASRRESLCSSWAAARTSLTESPLHEEDRRWSNAFLSVMDSSRVGTDPKLRVACDRLAELVRQNIKVVVFTQRLETSAALAKLLKNSPAMREKAAENARRTRRFTQHTDKIAEWLAVPMPTAALIAKAMGHAIDEPELSRDSVIAWWKRHRQMLADGDSVKLDPLIGRRRHLPVVVRHDSDTDQQEANLEKFNLPCAPLILIATPKAQEGIDLHHYCRHVLLFDLSWNPAAMEQRIGRVHRMGGTRKAHEKVNVIYCYQKGTYEESIASRVQTRCEMMRALLGAGQWLDVDRDIREISSYMMEFPA